ncbi:MAG: hypothetical protein JXR70_15260 [Spirochaetales bacterium]|nr:hypothetical protein [Spirochaetales bacterium]
MAKNFIKRTNYVIDKKFQLRFVAMFLVVIIISMIVFTGIVAITFWGSYLAGDNIFNEFITIYQRVPEKDPQGKPVLQNGKPVMTSKELPPTNRIYLILPPLLINNLIIMIMISVIGIFYSHRIAGPAFRIETDIARTLGGEKGIQIRLRKGDKLESLAQKVNDLIEAYEKK